MNSSHRRVALLASAVILLALLAPTGSAFAVSDLVAPPPPPAAAPFTAATTEDTTLTVAAPGLLTDVADPDTATSAITATLTAGPSHGGVSVASDGGFLYVPVPNWNGTDTFTFMAYDGTSYSATQTATITVSPVNDAPTAMPEAYSTPAGRVLNVAAPGVLGNDTDVEGASLTAAVVLPALHGPLVLNANGSFTYTPTIGYTGPDSFTYRAFDGTDYSATTTVSITVVANTSPSDIQISNASFPEGSRMGTVIGLLSATDPDSTGFTFTLVGGDTQYFRVSGVDLLTGQAFFDFETKSLYQVVIRVIDNSGSAGNTYDKLFNINVSNVNERPVATDWSGTIAEDTNLVVPAPGLLTDATDPDGDSLTATLTVPPSHGSMQVSENGAFVYTPDPAFSGEDTCGFAAWDGGMASRTKTASITVTPVYYPPQGHPDTFSTAFGTALIVTAPGVLANDSSPESATLSAVLMGAPGHGSLGMAANGAFSYTPNAGFIGDDMFTYVASDGSGASGLTTVTISVAASTSTVPTTGSDAAVSSITLRANSGIRRRGQALSLSGVATPGSTAGGSYKVYNKRPGATMWKAWSPIRTLSASRTWSWKTTIDRRRYPRKGTSYWKVALRGTAAYRSSQSALLKVVIR